MPIDQLLNLTALGCVLFAVAALALLVHNFRMPRSFEENEKMRAQLRARSIRDHYTGQD